ncbi:MAG: response regulator [Thermoguttaceae bacterium]
MARPHEPQTRTDALRRRAETMLAEYSREQRMPSPEDVQRLMHELEVYRVELEMQNEELRKNQGLLEESRDRYVDLYDFAPVGYVTLDSRGRIAALNLAATKMLQTERAFLIGKPFALYVAAEDKDRFLAFRHKSLEAAEPLTTELALHGGRDERRTVQLDSIGFDQAEGRFCRMTLTDISNRTAAEEQIRVLNATLEERVAERTALAKQRTGQLQALAVELGLTEQRERRRLAQRLHDGLQQLLYAARLSLETIRRHATAPKTLRAIQQTDDLLTQSLAESRSLTIELSPPVLYDAGLVAAVQWLARQFLEKQHLEVEVQAHDGVEPITESVRVFLFEAVRELLFNAVKHAQTNKVWVEVTSPQGEFVQVVVTDRGAGFDASRPPDADPGKGSFGLFSIRERLAALGGRLDIESTPGHGTRIMLTAPRNATTRVARRAARVRSEAIASENVALAETPEEFLDLTGNKIRVLLVDDHQILRQGMASMLMEEPDVALVGEATNGQEAIELARRTRPHLILMDVTMPVLDGVEATRRIMSELPETRVIGLSMHDESDLAEAMRKAGAVAYLSKGGPFDVVMDAIRNHVVVP